MKTILALSLLATTYLFSYDSPITKGCEELFEIAMKSKGTPGQDSAYLEFLECEEGLSVYIETPKKELNVDGECYSLNGAFIGKDSEICMSLRPDWINENGNYKVVEDD